MTDAVIHDPKEKTYEMSLSYNNMVTYLQEMKSISPVSFLHKRHESRQMDN